MGGIRGRGGETTFDIAGISQPILSLLTRWSGKQRRPKKGSQSLLLEGDFVDKIPLVKNSTHSPAL